MGVDYDASFGIGIEIEESNFNSDYECMEEWLDTILEDTPYKYEQYGEGDYTGKDNTFIIIMDDPFSDGYDITEKVNQMGGFLRKHSIDFAKIDIVGGLYVW